MAIVLFDSPFVALVAPYAVKLVADNKHAILAASGDKRNMNMGLFFNAITFVYCLPLLYNNSKLMILMVANRLFMDELFINGTVC